MSAKFGPAGNSESFAKMKYKSSLNVPEYIEKMGLDAYEYQCGRGVNINDEKATLLGKLAAEKGVMDNEYVVLGDTIEILPNDSDRIFVMPYTDWQNDSIRFVWEGEQEANVWLAVEKCDFTPDRISSFVWDVYTIAENMPHKLQQQEIVDIIKTHKNGGVYFGKVLSPVAGKLVVEKIPMAPIEGGATLLEYGKSVEVSSADQLFCFSRTWGATEFISSVGKLVFLPINS